MVASRSTCPLIGLKSQRSLNSVKSVRCSGPLSFFGHSSAFRQFISGPQPSGSAVAILGRVETRICGGVLKGRVMTISVLCRSCEYQFQVEAELRGKRIRCPSCGEPLSVGGVSPAPVRKKTSNRADRRRRTVLRESSQTSRTMMAAGIAATLITMAIATLIMMNAGSTEPEVTPPAGQESPDSGEEPSEGPES